MSDVHYPSSMSFNDADTFSFDKLADPEVLGVMNGGTIWDAPPMNPSANSNTAAQVMGMVSPWFVGQVGENQFLG